MLLKRAGVLKVPEGSVQKGPTDGKGNQNWTVTAHLVLNTRWQW